MVFNMLFNENNNSIVYYVLVLKNNNKQLKLTIFNLN